MCQNIRYYWQYCWLWGKLFLHHQFPGKSPESWQGTAFCLHWVFQHWEEKIELDQYCIAELRFWRANLNSSTFGDCFLIHKLRRFVYSDASATGCSSVITLNEEHICHRLWEPSECSKSCTWRGLTAIDFSLESFAPYLEGCLVEWFTDSQSGAKIVPATSLWVSEDDCVTEHV